MSTWLPNTIKYDSIQKRKALFFFLILKCIQVEKGNNNSMFTTAQPFLHSFLQLFHVVNMSPCQSNRLVTSIPHKLLVVKGVINYAVLARIFEKE